VNNHAGDFVVDLPKTYLLEGRWDCALTELTLHPQTRQESIFQVRVLDEIGAQVETFGSLLRLRMQGQFRQGAIPTSFQQIRLG
jgi:hypothetical protein